MTIDRRTWLVSSAALAASALLGARMSFAAGGSADARFVLVQLRGGLDGLAAVPAYGDSEYAALRRELAIAPPGEQGGALDLDGYFGLHPSLAFLHRAFREGELAVVHAVATPYRERSHFDAQNVLETGYALPRAGATGWLNRALAAMSAQSGRSTGSGAGAGAGANAERGVALGQNVPLVLRGDARVASWTPSRLDALDDDTLERIADLYANDPQLAARFADALAASDLVGDGSVPGMTARGSDRAASGAAGRTGDEPATGMSRRSGPNARLDETVRAAAAFLREDGGPDVAVLDTTGWDTHANEGGAEGQLAVRLGALDSALATLRSELGETWARTVVVIATEFGRTAARNGSRGTDHGTAGAAFVLGGGVRGGQVIADWPGLAAHRLHEGRDLAATLDLRSVLKGILAEHLGVDGAALAREVFPDSAGAEPLRGLVRAGV